MKPLTVTPIPWPGVRRPLGAAIGLFVALLPATGTLTLQAQEGDLPFRQVTLDETPPAKPYYKMIGDLDGDGDTDVAMAEMHQEGDPDEVTLHRNRGGGLAWHKQVLSTEGSHDLVAADIGADGDLDLVGANHAGQSHPLQLWQNELNPK